MPEFAEHGFVTVPRLLSPSLIEAVRDHLAALKESTRGLEYSRPNINLECPGGGFLGQTGTRKSYRGVLRAAFHLEQSDPFFADLGERGDVYQHVSALVIGHEPGLLSVNYWGKPARIGSAQPWHQDLAYVSPEQRRDYNGALTAWIALDPAHRGNGCLEFYPGSHHSGDLNHLGSTDPDAGEQIRVDVTRLFGSVQPTAVELEPGSAVIFDGRVVHGSGENTSSASRQALSFSYVY